MRTVALGIMMTPDEYLAFRIEAAKRGKTASTFGYELLKATTGEFLFSKDVRKSEHNNGNANGAAHATHTG